MTKTVAYTLYDRELIQKDGEWQIAGAQKKHKIEIIDDTPVLLIQCNNKDCKRKNEWLNEKEFSVTKTSQSIIKRKSYCLECNRNNWIKRARAAGVKEKQYYPIKIINGIEYKQCSITTGCGKVKPLSEFYGVSMGTKRSMCKECDSFYRKKMFYNLTREQLEQMMHNQNWTCPISGEKLTWETAVVDHNHACCAGRKSCGKCVRSLISQSANKALGLLNDDINQAQALIAYLEKYTRVSNVNNVYC